MIEIVTEIVIVIATAIGIGIEMTIATVATGIAMGDMAARLN